MLARDRELAALLLDLAEKPRVLNRDHRLRGESLEQIDGRGRERARRAPAHDERADDAVGPQQRHDEKRAEPGLEDDVGDGIVRLLHEIGDLHGRAPRRRLADAGGAEADALAADRGDHALVHADGGAQREILGRVVEDIDRAGVGLRQLDRVRDDGGEHGLEIERGVHRLR